MFKRALVNSDVLYNLVWCSGGGFVRIDVCVRFLCVMDGGLFRVSDETTWLTPQMMLLYASVRWVL